MRNYLARVWAAVVMAASIADVAMAADLRIVEGQVLKATPAVDGRPTEAGGIPADSIAQVLPDKGDPRGTRRWLAEHGVQYNFTYTNDVLSNVRGGLQRGTIDQGKLEAALTIDWEKLAGVKGLTSYANIFQIHDTGRIRRDYVGGINTIAAIEAVPTTRLSELWLEQSLWNGTASVRFGQLAADVEFFYSDLGTMFLQSDWPTITATNMPSGGPAYPLSTPGVRFKFTPNKHATFLFAVFNGDPAGHGWPGEEQVRNPYGLNFRLQDPALLMAEARFMANQGKEDVGLASMLKVGAWGHLGEFEDYRFANDGTLLADPAGSGVPARRKGNSGIYTVIEQQLFRPKGGDPLSGISVFSRISASPSDRNLIDFFVDGGIVFAGLFPSRPQDRFGASILYSRFSNSVRAFAFDHAVFTGEPVQIPDYEANLELTYMAQIMPGWTVQPVLTYVWHPAADPTRNATVVGGRSIWRY